MSIINESVGLRMETVEVARRMSFDYLTLLITLAVLFNLYLAATRHWKPLLIFNVGGLVNIVLEIIIVVSGTRHFSSDLLLHRVAAILALAWVTNGFLCAIVYIDTVHWLKGVYTRRFVIAANAFLFVGLPLAMIHYGLFDGGMTVWRDAPTATAYVEPVLFVALAAVIWLIGYKKLLLRMVLIGFLIDLHFEGSLLLFGIRDVAQFDLLHFITRVCFEMNIFCCIGFLALKAIFKLDEYKDGNL